MFRQKRYLFIGLIFLVAQTVAQTSQLVDSLRTLSKEVTSPQDKADIYNELAFQLRNSDTTAAIQYANQAIVLAEESDYTKGKADGAMRLGLLAKKKGDLAVAESHYARAVELRKLLDDREGVAGGYINLGNLWRFKGELEKANEWYTKGLKFLETDRLSNNRALLLTIQADVFSRQNQPAAAEQHLHQAIEIYTSNNNVNGLAEAYLNLGNIYFTLKNNEKTKEYYEKSLQLFQKLDLSGGIAKCHINLGNYYLNRKNNPQRAKFYYEKAFAQRDFLSVVDLALVYSNLATTLEYDQQYQRAEELYRESLSIYQDLGHRFDIARINNNLGSLYNQQRAYPSALNYFLAADSVITAEENPYLKSQLLFNIAETYRQLAQPDAAYPYLLQHQSLADTLNNNYIQAANWQRNQEEQEKKMAQLGIQEERQKRQFQLLIGLIILLALLSVVIWVVYNARDQRQQLKIAEYETEQAYQEIDNLLYEQEIKMVSAKLEGKDQEQQRIAKELHSRLGMMLATIKLYFNNIDNQLTEIKLQNNPHHQKANELLDEASEEVRRIAHDMEQGTLLEYGLVEGLKELIEKVNSSEAMTAKLFVHNLKTRLPSEQERKIYKIILDLVGNVLKHAKANALTIQLNRIEEQLNILIEDNGVGFQPTDKIGGEGMGLRTVALLVSDLNGTLHIDSGKGNGTTVAIDLPSELD